MYIELAEAKAFMRVEVNDDDALIVLAVNAAIETVEKFLNAPLSEFEIHADSDLDGKIPSAIKIGVLQYATEIYENREANMVGTTVAPNPFIEQSLHYWRRSLGV